MEAYQIVLLLFLDTSWAMVPLVLNAMYTYIPGWTYCLERGEISSTEPPIPV